MNWWWPNLRLFFYACNWPFVSIDSDKGLSLNKRQAVTLTNDDLFWCMMTSSNGNILRVTVPLCGELTSLTIVYSTIYSGVDQRKTSNLRVTGLCVGNSPVTGEFPAKRASNAENSSICWRHHVKNVWGYHDGVQAIRWCAWLQLSITWDTGSQGWLSEWLILKPATRTHFEKGLKAHNTNLKRWV